MSKAAWRKNWSEMTKDERIFWGMGMVTGAVLGTYFTYIFTQRTALPAIASVMKDDDFWTTAPGVDPMDEPIDYWPAGGKEAHYGLRSPCRSMHPVTDSLCEKPEAHPGVHYASRGHEGAVTWNTEAGGMDWACDYTSVVSGTRCT